MTKFLLGILFGYLFSDSIDDLIKKPTNGEKAPTPPPSPMPPPTTEEVPIT